MSKPRMDVKDLTLRQLTRWLEAHGIQPYRAGQILRWVHQRQADAFDGMSDLGIPLREMLNHRFTIDRLTVSRVEISDDGSRKYLFKLTDGEQVETVLIPERDHYTVCVSSQVGCAMGCSFCMTGTGGLVRNLTAGEIIAQVRDTIRDLEGPKRLTNIVFMGMGEPLANFTSLVNALEVLLDNGSGFSFASRRVTVSTAGIVPRIRDLGTETTASLAVSLNATEDQTRNRLMPINRRYPIAELMDACARYPLRPHRQITFEYVLLKGINDTEADARRLVRLLKPIRAKVNLIPFNTHAGSPFEPSEEKVIRRFQEILNQNSYTAVIRRSKGRDISAACGQLRVRARKQPGTV